MKTDGSTSYIRLDYGGTSNTESGYRLVTSMTLGTWTNPRLLLAVSSRHQGIGLISISIGTKSSIDSYEAEMKYYGSSTYYDTNAWTLGYNTSTGVLTLYWRYFDYSCCDCIVLLSKDFHAIENGTWVTALPSDIGDKYTATAV